MVVGGIERWLLILYLPLLAPIVLLTLFTWPWKLLGHSARGIALSLRSAWRGYALGAGSHRRRPFSFWRNIFMGTWAQLAQQHEATTGVSASLSAAAAAAAACGRHAAAVLPPAFHATLLQAADATRARLHLELRTLLVSYGIMAAFLFVGVVRPSHVPLHAASARERSPGPGAGGAAVDLAGLFSGLAFIIALAGLGVCAQLASLLNAAASPQQLYWFIVTWERALGGRQLANGAAVTFALAAALAAAYQLYAPWVFSTLLFTAACVWYGWSYFWADSVWCPRNGARAHYAACFLRELAGVECSPRQAPGLCGWWRAQQPPVVLERDVRGSLYEAMHRHLWWDGLAGVRCFAASSSSSDEGGSAEIVAAGSWKQQQQQQQQRSSTSTSSRLTDVTIGGDAAAAADPTASWPFMRHTTSGGSNGGAGGASGGAAAAAAAGGGGNGSSAWQLPQGRARRAGLAEAGGTTSTGSTPAATAGAAAAGAAGAKRTTPPPPPV
jgi:hypothetical protein